MKKRIDENIKIKISIILTLTMFLFSCKLKTDNETVVVPKDKILPPPPTNFDTTKTLKENTLLNYISLGKKIQPNKSNGIPFDNLDYDKIIAYDFVGSEEPYPRVIDEKGKFVPVVLGQEYLTQTQADKILKTLAQKSTYGEPTAACFNPHFALVFYKNAKMINQINICLDCNYLISDIAIPAETHKKVSKGTKEEYAIRGFTDKGKKEIIDLCKELKFTYGYKEIK